MKKKSLVLMATLLCAPLMQAEVTTLSADSASPLDKPMTINEFLYTSSRILSSIVCLSIAPDNPLVFKENLAAILSTVIGTTIKTAHVAQLSGDAPLQEVIEHLVKLDEAGLPEEPNLCFPAYRKINMNEPRVKESVLKTIAAMLTNFAQIFKNPRDAKNVIANMAELCSSVIKISQEARSRSPRTPTVMFDAQCAQQLKRIVVAECMAVKLKRVNNQ